MAQSWHGIVAHHFGAGTFAGPTGLAAALGCGTRGQPSMPRDRGSCAVITGTALVVPGPVRRWPRKGRRWPHSPISNWRLASNTRRPPNRSASSSDADGDTRWLHSPKPRPSSESNSNGQWPVSGCNARRRCHKASASSGQGADAEHGALQVGCVQLEQTRPGSTHPDTCMIHMLEEARPVEHQPNGHPCRPSGHDQIATSPHRATG